jgi:hypothetical protein
MKRIIVGAILGGMATVGIAQSNPVMSAFGLDIGKPLTLALCPGIGATKIVDLVQKQTCFEQASKYSNDRAKVHFGIQEVPSIIKGSVINVTLIDDQLEGLSFDTPGLEAKDRILGVLTEKYGAPTKFYKESLQNSFGARYESFFAEWDRPELYVVYTPAAGGDIKRGFIRIETQRARRQLVEKLREHERNKRNL